MFRWFASWLADWSSHLHHLQVGVGQSLARKLFFALPLVLPLVLTGEACLFSSSWSVVASER
jgi:hypothetical protein